MFPDICLSPSGACGVATKLTVAVFILNEHVVVLSPGRVVAYQVRMGTQYCMCTHLTEGCSSEERSKREEEEGKGGGGKGRRRRRWKEEGKMKGKEGREEEKRSEKTDTE